MHGWQMVCWPFLWLEGQLYVHVNYQQLILNDDLDFKTPPSLSHVSFRDDARREA